MKNLRAICDAATQGTWKHNGSAAVWLDKAMIATCNHEKYNLVDNLSANAKHIATFSPHQVRKLLDVIELQREALSGIVNHERASEVGYSDFGIAQNRLLDYCFLTSRAREALAKSEDLLK